MNDVLKCQGWPTGPHGAINALTSPSEFVLMEIDGMRDEHPSKPSREEFYYQRVDRVRPFRDMITQTVEWPTNYGLSVLWNFEHAFSRLSLTGEERVLEVGAEHDFPFLQPFRDLGCECFATNLYFVYDDRQPCAQVVLGDMNDLPYKDQSFDIVLMSATSHHSPDLAALMSELSRVVKPGGSVLLLNDPTHGLLKHAFGSKKGGDRHQLVNENEYPASAYHRLAKASGFEVQESFFSIYYDRKLSSRNVAGVRFASLARLVSLAWQINPIRRLLLKTLFLGQMLVGLEINLILRKPTS